MGLRPFNWDVLQLHRKALIFFPFESYCVEILLITFATIYIIYFYVLVHCHRKLSTCSQYQFFFSSSRIEREICSMIKQYWDVLYWVLRKCTSNFFWKIDNQGITEKITFVFILWEECNMIWVFDCINN